MSEQIIIAIALLCQSPENSSRGWQNKVECQKKLARCVWASYGDARKLLECVADEKEKKKEKK